VGTIGTLAGLAAGRGHRASQWQGPHMRKGQLHDIPSSVMSQPCSFTCSHKSTAWPVVHQGEGLRLWGFTGERAWAAACLAGRAAPPALARSRRRYP
jgi:hypothetical protein